MNEALKCGFKPYKDIHLLKAVFRKFTMSYLQTSRALHARTSAREFNLINRLSQLINFAFNPHARGQRAAADGTPRHHLIHYLSFIQLVFISYMARALVQLSRIIYVMA